MSALIYHGPKEARALLRELEFSHDGPPAHRLLPPAEHRKDSGEGASSRRRRCGSCAGCMRLQPCGECAACMRALAVCGEEAVAGDGAPPSEKVMAAMRAGCGGK